MVVPHKSPYQIDVHDLIHRPGELRERMLDLAVAEGFGNAVIGVPTGGLLHADLRLESLHEGILVSADVETVARGECVRCLVEVSQAVRVEIQEVFAYSQDEAFDYEIHDDTLDLESVVRDAVVLSLPFQPVCQEDCLGLCPHCGLRLLDNPGHEHEEPVDSRWGALAGLSDLPEFVTADRPLDPSEEEKR